MKKIILVAYDLNPRLGSESGVANIYLKLISKNFFVEVFTNAIHKKDILKESYKNVHFNFVKLNGVIYNSFIKLKLFGLTYSIFMRKVKPTVKNKIENNKFSIIHCLTPAGLHSYNDLYQFKIPIIVGPLGGALKTPSGFNKLFRKERLKNVLRNLFYTILKRNKNWRNYLLKADKIIIGTEYINKNIPPETYNKTTVIFDNLVDPNIFMPGKRKKSNKITIFYSGRLGAIKGCNLLLDAYSNLVKKKLIKKDHIDLIYAGNGTLLESMQKKVLKEDLTNNVKFLGRIKKSDVLKHLKISDIYCLPTIRDNGGGAILEAMACELPVITTNYGGPAYSVTKECGIKIEPTNYEDYVNKLEEALLLLINNKNLRVSMGKAGRQRVIAEFSPKAVEKKINKVYNEVLEKNEKKEDIK